jgi:hypothetical protein
MDWKEILTIILPCFAFLGWIYNRLDKRFDKIDKQFEKVDYRFVKIEEKLQNLDLRVARIEGHLFGGPRYEPKLEIVEKNK